MNLDSKEYLLFLKIVSSLPVGGVYSREGLVVRRLDSTIFEIKIEESDIEERSGLDLLF